MAKATSGYLLWFRDLELQPGKQVVWDMPANRTVSRSARGGRLGLTVRALLFAVNRLDAALGAKPYRIDLGDITSVSQVPASFNASPISGG